MKKFLLLIIGLSLFGCVQTASKKPILNNHDDGHSIAIVNAYSNTISTFRLGITIFQNESIDRELWNFSVKDYIEDEIRAVFADAKIGQIKKLNLSSAELNSVTFQQDESLVDYEKKIKNIPGVLQKARQNQVDQIVIITPSSIVRPNTNVSTWGTGLWYSNSLIEPYSTINLYIIDTNTNEIAGRHRLTSFGPPVELVNDLSAQEQETIKANHEKRTSAVDAEAKTRQLSLNAQMIFACTNMDRFDVYSSENQSVIENSLRQSLDYSVSQLANIYLNKPIEKPKNWRTELLRLSSPLSCKI